MTEELEKYYLHPGYIFANKEHTLISTVLGSCISICLWDNKNQYGGMNHYIYPKDAKNHRNCKYGNIAIPYLVKLMINLGSKKENLIAHVVGGASNPILKSNIGSKNAQVAEKLLKKQGIAINIWDVGGEVGRKLAFNTENGEILIHKGSRLREGDWYR